MLEADARRGEAYDSSRATTSTVPRIHRRRSRGVSSGRFASSVICSAQPDGGGHHHDPPRTERTLTRHTTKSPSATPHWVRRGEPVEPLHSRRSCPTRPIDLHRRKPPRSLRMEIDSAPVEIDELRRAVDRLKLEGLALKKEKGLRVKAAPREAREDLAAKQTTLTRSRQRLGSVSALPSTVSGDAPRTARPAPHGGRGCAAQRAGSRRRGEVAVWRDPAESSGRATSPDYPTSGPTRPGTYVTQTASPSVSRRPAPAAATAGPINSTDTTPRMPKIGAPAEPTRASVNPAGARNETARARRAVQTEYLALAAGGMTRASMDRLADCTGPTKLHREEQARIPSRPTPPVRANCETPGGPADHMHAERPNHDSLGLRGDPRTVNGTTMWQPATDISRRPRIRSRSCCQTETGAAAH
ncbi:hypothetical protein FQA39_LY18692 [Lamprigera yunnana]|nr:hypothetical protein FQA39_LY18692 [Lamprigera yunnana]